MAFWLTIEDRWRRVPDLGRSAKMNAFAQTWLKRWLIPAFLLATGVGLSTAVELAWSSKPDRVYQLQWTESVNESQWKNLGSVIRGTGGMLSIFDSTREHPRAFYRLLVVQ